MTADTSGIRVIADDLSGALDASAPFAACTRGFTAIWDYRKAPASAHAALDTCSREATLDIAIERIELAARRWWRGFSGIAFKKVDSVWRGHPAAEIAAAAAAGGFDRVIVAPAFPAHGRLTLDGRQWRVDAAGQRNEIADLVADLRAAGMQAAKEHDADRNTTAIVCDARNQAMLEDVAARHANPRARILWCGAGGLAAALARELPSHSGMHPPLALPAGSGSGPVFALVGSPHPLAQAQGDALALLPGTDQRIIDLSAIRGGGRRGPRPSRADLVLVRFVIPQAMPRDEIVKRVHDALSELVHELEVPRYVLVSGGETVRALCVALEASMLSIVGEDSPGVPVSLWVDGRWAGVPVQSKSGGFGAPDFYVQSLARVRDAAARVQTPLCNA